MPRTDLPSERIRAAGDVPLAPRDFLHVSLVGAALIAAAGGAPLGCVRSGPGPYLEPLGAGSASVLCALGETFDVGPLQDAAGEPLELAAWIDGWLSDREPFLVQRLRGALRMLDWAPFWRGTALSRFSGADVPARVRTLDSLGASRVALLRQLSGDPTELGYDGPWVASAVPSTR